MRDGPEAAAVSAAPSALGEADVLRFLKTHPDFLNRHPELFGALSPPKRAHGDGVIDLQHAMLERLRGEVTQLKDTQRSLIQTTRGNMNSTSRVHACVLALLQWRKAVNTTSCAAKMCSRPLASRKLPPAQSGVPSALRKRKAVSAEPSCRLMPTQSQPTAPVGSSALLHSWSSQARPWAGSSRWPRRSRACRRSCGQLR